MRPVSDPSVWGCSHRLSEVKRLQSESVATVREGKQTCLLKLPKVRIWLHSDMKQDSNSANRWIKACLVWAGCRWITWSPGLLSSPYIVVKPPHIRGIFCCFFLSRWAVIWHRIESIQPGVTMWSRAQLSGMFGFFSSEGVIRSPTLSFYRGVITAEWRSVCSQGEWSDVMKYRWHIPTHHIHTFQSCLN